MIWISSRTLRTVRIEEVGVKRIATHGDNSYILRVRRVSLNGLSLRSLLASSTNAMDGSQGKHPGNRQTEHEKLRSARRYIIQNEKKKKDQRGRKRREEKGGREGEIGWTRLVPIGVEDGIGKRLSMSDGVERRDSKERRQRVREGRPR